MFLRIKVFCVRFLASKTSWQFSFFLSLFFCKSAPDCKNDKMMTTPTCQLVSIRDCATSLTLARFS